MLFVYLSKNFCQYSDFYLSKNWAATFYLSENLLSTGPTPQRNI